MKGALSLALTVFALISLAHPPPAPAAGSAPAPDDAVEAPVVFVADGDTVQVLLRGRREWVRHLRIDTPEREEPGHESAGGALRGLVGGKRVVLVFEEPGRPERDRHGRLLAYLFVGERNMNVEMVRLGWSPFWTRYGEGKFAEDFRSAEDEARSAGAGMWGRGRGKKRSRVDSPGD